MRRVGLVLSFALVELACSESTTGIGLSARSSDAAISDASNAGAASGGCAHCRGGNGGASLDAAPGSIDSGSGGTNGLGGVGGAGGAPDGSAGGGAAGAGGSTHVPLTSCAEAEDVSLWSRGRALYVDDTPGCQGQSPCYSSIGGAYAAAASGDTVNVLAGTYSNIRLLVDDRNVRITGKDGPETTVVTGRCLVVSGSGSVQGKLWIDHLTFSNCGASTSTVEDGWGVYVGATRGVDVRIQDSVFSGNNGSGAIGLGSSFVGTRFHAVVARNRIVDNHSKNGALDVDLPADNGEDYCIRVENNVIVGNDAGVTLMYTTFKDGPGKFEFVNNTVANNAKEGFGVSQPAGRFLFVNNVIFGNPTAFNRGVEWSDPFDVRHNLVDSGEFTGLRGNFSADPLFVNAATGDFHLGVGSPAAGRGETGAVPSTDIEGKVRGSPPDIGAYERDEKPGEVLAGLACGDSKVESGSTTTAAGTFIGFETCDDGNTRDGDGCSSKCQFEPAAPRGQLSLSVADLCVIRLDQSLSCWGQFSSLVPSGAYRQVAVSQYLACALDTNGKPVCWTSSRQTTSPTGTFTQIGPGYGNEVCGVRSDGSIACWDEWGTMTRSQNGTFVRVDASVRLCGLSSAGAPTCWDPSPAFPPGPYLQMFPSLYGGCGLRTTGELECLSSVPSVSAPLRPLPAGLVQVSIGQVSDVGLRPDGHAVQWGDSDSQPRATDHTFIEIAAGFLSGCGLTPDHRAYCWDDRYGLPKE